MTDAFLILGRDAWEEVRNLRAEVMVQKGHAHCANMRVQFAEGAVQELRVQLQAVQGELQRMQAARDEALAESCGLRVVNDRLKNEERRAKRLEDLIVEIRRDIHNFPGRITAMEILDAIDQARGLEHEGPFLPLRCRLKSRKGGKKK